MYLVFLDESGSPYRNYASFHDQYEKAFKGKGGSSAPQKPFVLAGVGIHECHIAMVDEWFAGIKQQFLGNPGAIAGQDYEVKGEVLYALRQGRTPQSWTGSRKARKPHIASQKAMWLALKPYQLADLERSVFDLLGRLSPAVWAVVVKQRDHFRKHQARAWPPYYCAMTYLQQRVLHHIQKLRGAYERAMFLMDETSTLSSAAQFDDYLSMRETINSMAAWPVEFGRYLIDIPVFGKSHLHQALQLADIVSHTIWRHVKGDDPLGWFPQVEPLIATHWKTGEYLGCGLKFVP